MITPSLTILATKSIPHGSARLVSLENGAQLVAQNFVHKWSQLLAPIIAILQLSLCQLIQLLLLLLLHIKNMPGLNESRNWNIFLCKHCKNSISTIISHIFCVQNLFPQQVNTSWNALAWYGCLTNCSFRNSENVLKIQKNRTPQEEIVHSTALQERRRIFTWHPTLLLRHIPSTLH